MPTPASVTAVKSALKTAIEGAAEGTFALPLAVWIGDSASGHPPAVTDPMSVQIAFTGAAEIGRSSSRVLDQALIDCHLSYRYPNQSQIKLDNCNQVAERLRDLLLGFTTTGARVEQLLTPNPFEQQRALQGAYSNRITLDMDILRTIATSTPPTVTDSPILTATRNAVWDAIDNWPPFAASGDVPAAWVRKFKDSADVEELSLHDPAPADLPAIAVTWGPTNPEWWTNIQQQWHQQVFITCWLPADQQQVAEWRLMQLMQAVYQSGTTPSVSYIRRATGRPPSKNSPVSLEMVAIGRAQRLHAWKGQIALTLTTNLDPNA